MTLYTPIAEFDVFPNQGNNVSERIVATYQSRSVYVEKNDDGNYQIVKLLSTDPKDFMDSNFQPGAILPSL